MDKQIANLQKQNEGMENSFKNKGIQYNKLSINAMDQETELSMLKEYNNYLKGISAANRPVQEKPKPKANPIPEQPKQPKTNNDEDDDDIPKEVKPSFSTIANMEDIKRSFFSNEYETFHTLVKEHPFKYYKANFRYAEDYNGRPSFMAKNLLRGFVQNLDDYRKYLMVCFRCISMNDENDVVHYKYPSYWIVNSNDDLKTILGSLYDDYEFISIENHEQIERMLKRMEKNTNENDENLIGEAYLH